MTSMVQATLVSSTGELDQILQLQKENLPENIDDAELKSQGFVTLHHTRDVLKQMHDIAPAVIVKDNAGVAGYALTMFNECRQLVPNLEPMFALFDKLNWNNKPLNSYRFYVMGQICVAKAWRGQGLVEMLYQEHKKVYQPRFDLIITEISNRNTRSIRAHEKVGFKTIHTHRDKLDEWVVVGWDWS